jgi:DNA-3-methyladenine glycosylase
LYVFYLFKLKIFILRNRANVKKLEAAFYQQNDVVQIARDLVGKLLVTRWEGQCTIGRIVETEAYRGVTDKASHAYGGRRTARTEIMYAAGGVAYVYLCYGMHHLFNVVTGKKDEPHAVLLRGIEPLEGLPIMYSRTGKRAGDISLGAGPGNLARAMGIKTMHTGQSLVGDSIYIADDGFILSKDLIMATPRIGVDYAGEDAGLPYRFIFKDNLRVSKRNAFLSSKK